MNEMNSWFFEKINKADKHLATLIKIKREKAQINKIRDKMKRKISLTDLDETVKYDLESIIDSIENLNTQETTEWRDRFIYYSQKI